MWKFCINILILLKFGWEGDCGLIAKPAVGSQVAPDEYLCSSLVSLG